MILERFFVYESSNWIFYFSSTILGDNHNSIEETQYF